MRHFIACLGIVFLVFGCADPNGPSKTVRLKVQQPIYMAYSELRSAVRVTEAPELKQPGKIYVYGRYLLVSEIGKGVHVFDNANPSAPREVAFITVPGTGDLAVRDNILYVDSYIDLVAIDITDPASPSEVHRVKDIFPQSLNTDGYHYADPDSGIVVGWREVEVDVEQRDGTLYFEDEVLRLGSGRGGESPVSPSAGGGGQSGTGGSMARFTIVQSWLYAVTQSDLQLFNITTPSRPLVWARVNLGWGIETIFPYKDKLFIGSMTGMFIFDNSNPSSPTMLSEFRHARACDPVVAADTMAYVTLRSGTMCGGGQNQVDLISISDLMAPRLIKSYFMQEPNGVGIDGTTLFVCDGRAGLKIFDASNPLNLRLLAHMPDWHAYDIIPLGSRAILTGNSGIVQFDYTNPSAPFILSTIHKK